MQITDVKVRRLMEDGRLRAVVSVTLGDEIAIHDLKVIEALSGFLSRCRPGGSRAEFSGISFIRSRLLPADSLRKRCLRRTQGKKRAQRHFPESLTETIMTAIL